MTRDQARRVLGLVGLGVRARNATVGVEQVRAAAKKGTLVLVLVASDAAENSLDKLLPLMRARHIPTIEGLAAAELGTAAGRVQTAAIGIVDRSLAKGILGVVETGAVGPT
ncbi:MAG: ribosomal L7Ae/L30e/S12e/Gadd45 family protein [Gemmatimonadaceae bacterium]|nr:ribosomal L7Ae/L30e/S12e/Gadd45 family protein [Gemmatimonadaceae bacterium]